MSGCAVDADHQIQLRDQNRAVGKIADQRRKIDHRIGAVLRGLAELQAVKAILVEAPQSRQFLEAACPPIQSAADEKIPAAGAARPGQPDARAAVGRQGRAFGGHL